MKTMAIVVTTLVASPMAFAAESVTLTVHEGERALFRGFGVNQPERWNRITDIPGKRRKKLAEMIGDLRLRVLRIWADGLTSASEATVAKRYFKESYIDTGFIADYLEHGNNPILILSPWHWNDAVTEKTSPKDPTNYANNVAELIRWARHNHGITIQYTGIANEPGSWQHGLLRDGIKALRAALDKRGLQDVGILAPEYSGAKPKAMDAISSIKTDNEAWRAVAGVSTHSYNMAVTEAFADLVANNEREYWQTEASEVPNIPYQDYFTPTVAARILNDLNHRVSYWLYFVGFFAKSNRPQALIYYNYKTGETIVHSTYYALRQISDAIGPNASTRYVTTSRDEKGDKPDMTYSYGQKSALNAAAALNADGSWGLAVVNDTDISKEHYDFKGGHSKWYPATTFDVTFEIDELKPRAAMKFSVRRSGKGQQQAEDDQPLTMHDGKITVRNLQPWDLVTLHSSATVPPASSAPDQPDAKGQVLSDGGSRHAGSDGSTANNGNPSGGVPIPVGSGCRLSPQQAQRFPEDPAAVVLVVVLMAGRARRRGQPTMRCT